MAKSVSIKMNGKPYPLKFGYGAIRILGDLWALPGFVEVVERVGSLVPKGDSAMDLSFENLDLIGDLIWAGALNASESDVLEGVTRQDAVDAFFSDIEKVKDVFELFMASMPKASPAPVKKKATKIKATR